MTKRWAALPGGWIFPIDHSYPRNALVQATVTEWHVMAGWLNHSVVSVDWPQGEPALRTTHTEIARQAGCGEYWALEGSEEMATCSIAATVHRVLELLVAGDYQSLERISTDQGLTAGQLAAAVEEYGRKLRMPPDEELDGLIAIFPIQDSDPPCWSVDVDLWTEEEGHSDLTLQLELTESGRELCEVQVVDLHVL